jgi:hypothetical protein
MSEKTWALTSNWHRNEPLEPHYQENARTMDADIVALNHSGYSDTA